jgi:hypothetical protein
MNKIKVQITNGNIITADCISYRKGKFELYNNKKFVINLHPSLIKQIIVNENMLPKIESDLQEGNYK